MDWLIISHIANELSNLPRDMIHALTATTIASQVRLLDDCVHHGSEFMEPVFNA